MAETEGRTLTAEVTVEARELSKRFGSFTAVDRVSLEVLQGEVFGFLGPNGAGKTTTIRMLCGIIAPSSGAGRVLGLDISQDTLRVRRRIGYMSQRFSLYDDLSPEENMVFFGTVYGVERSALSQAVKSAQERFGLVQYGRALARELPTAARQRLALACALLHDPGVLFLDEPTSGMDPASRREFWDLVHGLAGSGKTVLVTTHYMDEAEYCGRLCLINQGRVRAQGTPDEVRGLATRSAIGIKCAPLGRGLAALLRRPELGEAAIYGDRLRLVTAEPDRAASEAAHLLAAAGVAIERVEPEPAMLEDVFVQLAREQGQT